MFEAVKECRICGNKNLHQVLDLGEQALTGIFPKLKETPVKTIPLVLVKCMGAEGCGLLQLKHTGDLSEMYGDNYGYRSGLNASMVRHLQQKVARILALQRLEAGDLVIDIGSNDSTTLQAYPNDCLLYGVDPTGTKFKKHYPPHIHLIPEFFSAAAVKTCLGDRKAKVITSFSMFYDLPQPMRFMQEVAECLDKDGIWVCEQSYMPTMLEMNSYDTVCHEHLEYYAFSQIQWMAERSGLKIVDLEFNDVNGGSFSFTATHKSSKSFEVSPAVAETLAKETRMGLDTLKPYEEFAARTATHRQEVLDFLRDLKSQGMKVLGYGASTKGNVLLQYCGITESDISHIAEVNEEKFGTFTPGTRIPIISEARAKDLKPDYYFVLPWHFRRNILEREKAYLSQGGKFIFPLPQIKVEQLS